MIREVRYTKNMSNKEIVYIVASEWVDEICNKSVEIADELMNNPYIKRLVVQAAEQKLRYEDRRKKVMFGDMESDDFWYTTAERDWNSYKTVLYDVIFHEFGANNSNI